jgi:sugar phosphate isomerase/epimerase
MKPHQILPSTTSHKKEPLAATLDVFARLGMRELDVNLWHIIEEGVDVGTVKKALAAGGQTARIVSGGWCDFFDGDPGIERTYRSVARQVQLAHDLSVPAIRLFFGRLRREDYSPAALDIIARNIRRLADSHPGMTFMFENHGGGASGLPEVCRDILTCVSRPNVRFNFDPINFEHVGVNNRDALAMLRPFVGHVHLKGLDGGEFCEFGSGGVDLTPVLMSLVESGYGGGFTVEYEGAGDRTIRLYESVRRAEAALHRLTSAAL